MPSRSSAAPGILSPPGGSRGTRAAGPWSWSARAGGPAGPGRLLGPAGRALLASAGGYAASLAFPGRGWWPLAALSVAALVLAVHGRRARTAAALGLLYGLAFFAALLHWTGVYVGALPWLALACLEALFMAALGAVLPRALRARGGAPGRALAVAGVWVADEAARARLPFGGFGWGRLVFSQSQAPTLNLARYGGAALVSFAVALAGAALALTVLALTELRPASAPVPGARHGRVGRRARAAALLAIAGLAAASGAALPVPQGRARGERELAVTAVQGDVPQPGLGFNARRRAVLDNHARLTGEHAAQVAAGRARAPDLVLWPENASDIDPLRAADAARVIQRAADGVGAPILVGTVLQTPPGMLSNVGIVWYPRRSVLSRTGVRAAPGPGVRYTKRRPAPFGEYIPYRAFFRRLTPKVDLVGQDFAPGAGTGVLPVQTRSGPVRLGDVICFEVVFDDLVRGTVASGADLLVVQTNNATFGFTDESVQQLAMSRIRAVETGRWVVHVSTVGVSAIIDPGGALHARAGLFTPAVLSAQVGLRTERTPAVRYGGPLEGALAGLGLLLVLLAPRPRNAQ